MGNKLKSSKSNLQILKNKQTHQPNSKQSAQTNNSNKSTYFPLGKSLFVTKNQIYNLKNDKQKEVSNYEISLNFELHNIKIQNTIIEFEIFLIENKNENSIFSSDLRITDERYLQISSDVIIPYFFEKTQLLKISLTCNEVNSFVHLYISNIITAENKIFYITDFSKIAHILIKTKEWSNEKQVEFKIQITSDEPLLKEIFYMIKCKNLKICKSEETFPDSNNEWNFSPFSLPLNFFFYSQMKTFTFVLYEYISDHLNTERIFEVDVDLNEGIYKFNFENGNFKGSILINLRHFKLLSFLDYIEKGLKINLIVGVDFSGSNGHPDDPESYHYIKNNNQTQYEKAILAVGETISHYDNDQKIPIYGFGGIPPNELKVNHCFSLKKINKMINFPLRQKSSHYSKFKICMNNLKEFQKIIRTSSKYSNEENNQPKRSLEKDPFGDDYVEGLEGLIDEYKKSVRCIVFSGPSAFSPLLEKVKKSILSSMTNSFNDYYILLILTDGQITDMKQAINSIVHLSCLPISIILVGIGNTDDFESMNFLDGDEFPLTNYNNIVTSRDIVQFVEYEKFKDNHDLLSLEVLKEIPMQVESYYNLSGYSLDMIY